MSEDDSNILTVGWHPHHPSHLPILPTPSHYMHSAARLNCCAVHQTSCGVGSHIVYASLTPSRLSGACSTCWSLYSGGQSASFLRKTYRRIAHGRTVPKWYLAILRSGTAKT